MDKKLPVLYYKGYLAYLFINSKDRNRIYGSIAKEGFPKDIIIHNSFAGNNIQEVKERFRNCVEQQINLKNYNEKNKQWKDKEDYKSIATVYNILPNKFKARLEASLFDKTLIEKVKGGFYEVPLYYVTKAWDCILKSNLCGYGFMAGPSSYEEDNHDIQEWRDFIIEESPKRFRCQAIADNNNMKGIWMKYFGIDIDSLNIDFSKYNRHIMPNVDKAGEYSFFHDVPNGVFEYIFDPINHPSEDFIFFDTISDIMEAASVIKHEEK